MSNEADLPTKSTDSNLIANRYQLQQQLGKGTFGVVYRADDLKFNPPRAVALKLLHSKFLNEAEVRADIEHEASVLARFSHPNILRVIDFDISETQAFIVTELAEGGSLARKIRPDASRPPVRMALDEVARYLEQICEAMDEAHTAGLVHRDLKPLNILLDKRGRPVVADFGLATALSTSQSSVLVDASASGTPPYMAPEQWLGHAGKASDIYALGVITYQLITGQLPFQGDQSALAFQHLQGPIPKLSDWAPDLQYPPALDEVIAGVLAKDPRQRTKPALEFYRHFKVVLCTGTATVRPVKEDGLPPTVNIPSPNYFAPTQTQQPASTQLAWQQPNAAVNPTYQPTQNASQPPNIGFDSTKIANQPLHVQVGSPFDVTQISGQQPAATASDSTKVASQPPGNFQAGPAYPKNQGAGPFASTQAAPSYDWTKVIGPTSYEPPVQPVVNFNGNQAQTAPVIRSKKNNLPIIIGAVALVLVAAVVGAVVLLGQSGSNSAKPGPAIATASTPAVATASATTSAVSLSAPVLLKTLTGHSKIVTSVAFSPDNKTLASGSLDTNIKLWDVSSGKELKTLPSNNSFGEVNSVMFSPDGKTLAAGYRDVPFNLWDVASGKDPKTFSANSDGATILSVAFSPNGKTIAGAFAGKIIVWDVASGKILTTLTGHSATVYSVSYSPDGKTIASSSGDNTLKLWDAVSGKEIKTFSGHSDKVVSVMFNPDGKTIASGSSDKTLKLWDVAFGKELTTLTGHSDIVNKVIFSPDGKTLASGSADKTIKLWDVASGKVLSTLSGHSSSVSYVAFSPDGKTLASGSTDKTIKLWQVNP